MNNEFIVWDNEENAFYEVDTLIGTCNGYRVAKVKALKENTEYSCYGIIFDWDYSDNDEIFVPIGIEDINGKKIYADSSVCEFVHKSIKQIGIVKYSIDYAYYYFDVKNGSSHIPLYMVNKSKIKIIDTIQENKLGLMNE